MATFTFNGELTFHDKHKVECKPIRKMEVLNNSNHFKMTISPHKEINFKNMAVKQIKSDWATGNRSLQKNITLQMN